MKSFSRSLFRSPSIALFLLTGCEELQAQSLSSTQSTAANPSAGPQQAVLTKHDATLHCLTSYTRLDCSMAPLSAEPAAVATLDWNRSHNGDIPYYDNKLLLQFRAGWARVYFQEQNDGYRISDLDVHQR